MALPARRLSIQFTAIGARVRNKVSDAALLASIDASAKQHAEEILDDIREYPSEPPGSTYTRTRELYDSWKIRRARQGQNTVYFITNDATDYRGRSYATFVQGQFQTSFHAATGWKNINDYTRREVFRLNIQSIITYFARQFTSGR